MSDLPPIRTAFAQALLDADARARMRATDRVHGGAPSSIYYNNNLSGLASALRLRFPVVQQLVGAEFFAAMGVAYAAEGPHGVLAGRDDGEDFPEFVDRFAPAEAAPYLGDVARIERARWLAHQAADAVPVERAVLTARPAERLDALRLRLHPSVAIVSSQYPVFSIWQVNQDAERVAPISPWAPEAALVARPFLRVETRRIPHGSARFIQELARGGTFSAAVLSGTAAAVAFDRRQAIALLIEANIVVGFGGDWDPLHGSPIRR
jgi:Putative DNA-binding domain